MRGSKDAFRKRGRQSRSCRHPLWQNATLLGGNGHTGVVRMLLERERVDPDQADSSYGRTPLRWAARYRHARVVKMLLERQNVNPSQKVNAYGETPLVWAQQGYEEVVKVLWDEGTSIPTG